jgi:phosphoglycolate phosphatase
MSSLNKISAVFFDLDGTLLDTASDILAALNFALEKNNFSPANLEQLIPYVSKGSLGIIKDLLKLDLSDKQLQKFRNQFITAYNNFGHKYTKLYPGITEVIEQLSFNNIPWGIITNKNTAMTMPIIEQLNLYNLNCKTVVCADTTAHSKPHPAPMLKACADLNVNPDHCIFVGDAQTDILAGKAVNMRTIAAAYGYLANPQDINHWAADWIINSPIEIIKILETLEISEG